MGRGVCGTCGDEDMCGWCCWLPGGIVRISLLTAQLGFDLVRELPQIGYSLTQIGKLSVDSACFNNRSDGKHHTELLERRFHGCSFDKIPFVTAPGTEGIIPFC